MNSCFNLALIATLLSGLSCCLNPATGFEHTSMQISERSSAAVDSDGPTGPLSDDDEKLTIKKIMKLAHKDGLLKKVATGKATDPEIAELHKFYLAMPDLTPPKGDEKSWKDKTAALIEASQAAVDKDPKASALLKSATDCAACHKVHK